MQTTTKIRRNSPCPYGSGLKYKKCYEKKKEQSVMEPVKNIANAPLKNEFRKEVGNPYAGIAEDELIARDQQVLLLELRFQVDGYGKDREHIKKAIEAANALRIEILALPKSPGKEGCLNDLKVKLEELAKKIIILVPPRQMLITLLALEKLLVKSPENSVLDEKECYENTGATIPSNVADRDGEDDSEPIIGEDAI